MFDSLDTYSLVLIGWLMLGAAVCGWMLLDPRWEDQPNDARRVSGLLTTVFGIISAMVIVFAPLYTQTETQPDGAGEAVETTERISLWDQGLPPEFALMLAMFTAVMIIIGRCAVPEGRARSREALILIWASAFVLLFTATVTILSVGVFLIPVAALAFVTAIHALRARNRALDEADSETDSDQEFQHSGI